MKAGSGLTLALFFHRAHNSYVQIFSRWNETGLSDDAFNLIAQAGPATSTAVVRHHERGEPSGLTPET